METRPRNPEGTPYKTEDLRSGAIPYTEDSLEAWYRWSLGKYLGKYLEGLREGKIYGRRCNSCGRIYVPPREVCHHCFRTTDEWVEVGDVVSYISADRGRVDEPIIIAVIELEGASPGVGILHRLGKVSPEEVKSMKIFGKRVRAVWRVGLARYSQRRSGRELS